MIKIYGIGFTQTLSVCVHLAQLCYQRHIQHGSNPFLAVVRPFKDDFFPAAAKPDKGNPFAQNRIARRTAF